MKLQLDSLCALSLLFSFSHFIPCSLQSPMLGRSSKAAINKDQNLDVYFWYPQIDQAGYDDLRNTLHSNPPKKKTILPSLSLSTLKTAFNLVFLETPTNRYKKIGSSSQSSDWQVAPDVDVFKQQFVARERPDGLQMPSFTVHQAVLKAWNSATDEELDRCLDILSYANQNDVSPAPTVQISLLYGLNSLHIKFSKHKEIQQIQHRINKVMIDVLISIQANSKVTIHNGGFANIPWAQEILCAKEGFGVQVGFSGPLNSDNTSQFKKLVTNDPTFVQALVDKDAIKTINDNFEEYNSYKRVIALAIYFHITKVGRYSRPRAEELFKTLVRQKPLLPHEEKLVQFIAQRNSIPIEKPKTIYNLSDKKFSEFRANA